jgi:hypothetical protein
MLSGNPPRAQHVEFSVRAALYGRASVSRTIRGRVHLIWLSLMCLPSAAAIGPQAVWRPAAEIITTILQKCGKAPGSGLADCFMTEMRASGASPEALAFSRQLHESTNGLIGFLRSFRAAGRVDVAYVEYVFRANENLADYLVNGEPPLIDVDDLKILPTKNLESDNRYKSIRARYPNVSIWPSDRSTTEHPIVKTLDDGGQRFILSYWLQNGCHACERIGAVEFAFDFDENGKFLGAHLYSVEPASSNQ